MLSIVVDFTDPLQLMKFYQFAGITLFLFSKNTTGPTDLFLVEIIKQFLIRFAFCRQVGAVLV